MKVGALSKFAEVEAYECRKIIGYKPSDYAELWTLMDYVREEIPNTKTVYEVSTEN